jgi:lipopolysaccharide/colanic/teichoic acid biosynthesis glycosyltransferase
VFWRRLLFLCASLDLLGALGVLVLLGGLKGTLLLAQPTLVVVMLGSYVCFGWLLGSYTVLRWPWLRLRLVVLRLGLTGVATLSLMALLDWAINLQDSIELTHRSTLLAAIGLTICWSLLVRLGLRLLVRRRPEQLWRLMAGSADAQQIQREWQRTPFVQPLGVVPPGGVVLGSDLLLAADQEQRLKALVEQGLTVTTVVELAEAQLERLPPSLLPEEWLAIDEIPWAYCFSIQRQLKRSADVLLALMLLLISLPLLLLLALLIWLEDRGPVLYIQQRSGLMGKPFALIKLRTMSCGDHHAPATWTVPADCRITRMGSLLRPARLDELPQLLNVLAGDMSLIGPRPERPELEHELEARIPHYRKRHWMRPGLSGWAQVCAPYAASVEEAELKLSYDLFYLRNWSTWIDLLILFKTVKTVLKVGGR